MQNKPFLTFWRKHWIPAAFIAGAIIGLTGLWLFCNRVQTNPERTFWGMVEQSLSTSSVTMQAFQSKGSDSMKQTTSLSLGSQNAARTRIDLKQSGVELVTDVIGTPDADYTRYVSVKASKEVTGGRNLNTKGLTDTWAKSDPQMFGQASLGLGLSLGSIPVPVGSLNSAQRAGIMKEMQERVLYRVDFGKVSKEHKDGRLLYAYDVETAPFVYVQIMKLFADNIGIKTIEQIDPENYRQLDTVKMRLTVDVRARHLKSVTFKANNYTQNYSSYGAPLKADIPGKTITLDELSGRFRQVLQL